MQGEELLNGQFLRKSGNFIFWSRYELRCGLCGNEKTMRVFPFGKRYLIRKLLRQMNTCHRCGHRICDDCYVITDDSHMIDGICKECAAEMGITGKTTTEFLKESTDLGCQEQK